ncbi:hypothetical protein DHEL01_v200282 [Diaporthe helianthi]|uniref:Uncharacterized protein n=1 Tax=Diaporthe helianthi TaxID=158607 RepID=A0A2P5IFM7_DIAHE|nr:hypothetical protein DHEL01_v200282 [Diaporthe helianthi]
MPLPQALGMAGDVLAGGTESGYITEGLLEGHQYSIFAFLHNISLVTFTFICLFSGLCVTLMLCGYVFHHIGFDTNMASDTVPATPVYHNDRSDRPIRPLPKRRLRELLSPEVADSIEYPPVRHSAPALFSYPCNLKGTLSDEESGSGVRGPSPDLWDRTTPRNIWASAASETDEASTRRAVVARPSTEYLGRSPRLLQNSDASRQGRTPQPPLSAASSADGYDSFENTNNKKKRKIPTAGEMNGSHGLGDHGLNDTHVVSSGLAENVISTSVPYYGSGSSKYAGQNVSGPGRGRFGRARTGRSPLQILSDASGNWLGRNPKNRSGHWSPTARSTGIISNAIANAEKNPTLEGQENTSLLYHQQPVKSTPATTQFTFTCDSQVPGTLAWPGSDPKMSNSAAIDYSQSAAGTYTHSRASQTPQPVGALGGPDQEGAPSEGSLRGEAPQSAATLERRNRRRAARDLHLQARKRREGTARQNFLNPPKLEDQWICEFCEYERIFGYPPVALIRQYEIKDRKIRQQEEERRRVWEKAKARSRKGKKSKAPSKKSTNNNTNSNGNGVHNHPNDAHAASSMSLTQSHGTQSDVFDDEDYVGEGNDDVDPSQPPAEYNRFPKTLSERQELGCGGGGDGGGRTVAGAGATQIEGAQSKI